MKFYDHKDIEDKWQKVWNDEGLYRTSDTTGKPKKYVLDMFPYPSGDGLHVGHPKGYIGTDVYSRKAKMEGFNVLHPMGWDAFGLPAENYAIENKLHPKQAMDENVRRFKKQLMNIGFNYDWSREVDTTDPQFYKWTQWIFLQMFHKGLAYESYEPINWCPNCQTGLANEDLEDGLCERCHTPVEKRPMRQWVLRITDYADRLLSGLEELPWPESVKESQRNWIGRSEGAELFFPLNKKFRYVILHGYKGSPEKNFIPWLKTELEKEGHEVVVPALPDPDTPSVESQVEYALKNMTFDNNTILIGHSLGSVVAAKLLELSEQKIHKLILAAGFTLDGDERRRAKYLKDKNWTCDYEKVREKAGSIEIVEDTNDETVTPAQIKRLKEKTGGIVTQVKAEKPHITAEVEPSVLFAALPGIRVFTTRPDTLFGATYMVLAPEHPLIETQKQDIENWSDVSEYIEKAKNKTEIERTAEGKEKTGVLLEGLQAKNPATGENIPVYVADYVLAGYGSGAIMAVPAHDERDYEFAQKYDLPIRTVIEVKEEDDKSEDATRAFTGAGVLVNSGEFDGMESGEAKKAITEFVGGVMKTNYKLRDWVFSRQRYWGEPIPILHCEKCGVVPVPEQDLPVTLPDVKSYEPTGTGESPLADISQWVNTTCPDCGGAAKRETNTMPQWAGSSWYYLRYIDPKNDELLVDPEKEKYWMPVDLYVGGVEHATRHLIYARFWHKFLYDIGVVSTPEPFARLKNQGIIQAEDGRKMSKRWGNVINPDDIVEKVGADTLRVYEMFMGPFEQSIAWSTDHMTGSRRFLERVWKLAGKVKKDAETPSRLIGILHRTIKKVGGDIEDLKFNTAISTLMKLAGEMEEEEYVAMKDYEVFLLLLAPFAPHMTEELWRNEFGHTQSIHVSKWPEYDEMYIREEKKQIGVQVNGKVRDSLEISVEATEDEALEAARALSNVARYIEKGEVTKVIYVPGKILNIIVKEKK